jgi:hypothetical protein
MSLPKVLECACAVLFAGVLAASSSSAAACDPPCRYQKVVTYACQQVPYQVCVIQYDHCGHPYHAYETRYREVQVPVVKWVKVCY